MFFFKTFLQWTMTQGRSKPAWCEFSDLPVSLYT